MLPSSPFPPDAVSSDAPIGVFDSGVGGLSVLHHIRAQLPHEHLIYVADSGHAPYGGKTEQFVAERALAITAFLVARGAKALVVACNTATIAAIKAVRAHYPLLPVVGVEPGLKPAAAATHSGTVGVLATQRTLTGEKFLLLREQIGAATGTMFLLQPCIGLVDQIELGDLGDDAGGPTCALPRRYVAPLLAQGADTLVLGCTHYPFVRPAIARVIAEQRALHGFGDIGLIDTGDAVARQLVRLLDGAQLLRSADPAAPPQLQGCTTAGAPALAAAFGKLLGIAPPVETLTI